MDTGLRRAGVLDETVRPVAASATQAGELSAWHFATRQPVRVRWAGGVITHLEPAPAPPPPDVWIAPTLCDLQINGYAGVDFQQDDLAMDDLLRATRGLRAAGCAKFLLTLITDDWSPLTARLRHLRAVRAQSVELQSTIVGWHIEGPFLSAAPGFHGAHDPALMLDPRPEHLRELRALTGDDPLLLTIAPERPGALAAIELAASLGLKISLGHTDATAEILAQAVAAGATKITHLANGSPPELIQLSFHTVGHHWLNGEFMLFCIYLLGNPGIFISYFTNIHFHLNINCFFTPIFVS